MVNNDEGLVEEEMDTTDIVRVGAGNWRKKDGKFFIKGSIIDVSITELTPDTIKFVFSLKDNILNLSSFPSSCDEGCYDSYRRIADDG